MPEVDTSRDMHRPGHFSDASDASLMHYCADIGVTNLVLVKAIFSETIPTTVPKIGPVRLAHIDCDLYQSVAESYDGLKRFMVPDGYIAFNDPLISSCLGAFEAVEELVIRRDGLHAEQASPHLVLPCPAGSETESGQ